MNKSIYHKVLPFVCALSILVSLLVVPASAASGVGKDTGIDTANRNEWAEYIVNTDPVFKDLFASQFGVDLGYKIFFRIIDDVVGKRYGEVELDVLHAICAQLNDAFCNKPISDLYSFVDVLSAIGNYTLVTCFRLPNVNFEVVEGGATAGYYRIQDTVSGLFITNAVGLYPCTPVDGEFTDTDKHNHWISKDSAEKNFRYSQVMTGADMKKLCASLQVGGVQAYVSSFGDKYKAIYRDGREVYANPDGYPFLSAADDSEWVVNQSRPDAGVKDENGDILEELPEENTSGIDLSGMTITLPDGSINFIDKIIYDESTKSYHIDSHDTYNYTTYNYYTWNYYINYTSITYIGQTEEYDKYYEVYYELPDGRSSADLTKEDLEQLNLSIDVIPYVRSADDTSLRSLYHFDGDTKDSSYWNYCTEFTWNKGASLTYMDASTFGGALYLDEKQHDFTFTLPSSIGTSDLTLQFRYYQSATLAPQTDTTLYFGSTSFAKMNGSHLLDGGGSKQICEIPIGTWNEICFMRKDGKYCWYLNGVVCSQGTWATSLSNSVRFSFGDQQQTFKYFDEFRFVDEAVYELGRNYEVSSVPHDTNLTLVLPDSQVPVADEYWSFENPTQTNLLSQYGLDKWAGFTSSSKLNQCTTLTTYDSSNYGYTSAPYRIGSDIRDFPRFTYYSNLTNFNVSQSGLNMTFNESNGLITNADYAVVGNTGYSSNYFAAGPTGGLFTVLGSSNTNQNVDAHTVPKTDAVWCSDLPAGDYTFSLVNSDGEVSSVSFVLDVDSTYKAHLNQLDYSRCTEDFGYRFGLALGGGTSKYKYLPYFLVVQPISSTPDDIVYMELVSGSSSDLSAEWVESVVAFDKDSVDKPTLAVRTDIDIASYQIGGVRPSLPEKGMVWAMVENERITSLQVYNGQAWEGVDGRIWTGERWIPMSSYNIITLQDLYDIVDATPNYEYIYSEAGFWAWWQKSWNAFQEKLFQALGSGGSGGGSIVPGTVKQKVSEALSSLIEGVFGTITEVLKSLIGAAQDLLSGIFSFFSDTVFGGIRDFFSSFDELINPFETTIENEDGSTTTAPGLPDDVVTGLGFFSGLIMLIPDEVRVVLFFFAGLTLFIAILKRFA